MSQDIMTIEEARKFLGKTGESLGDLEVGELITFLYKICINALNRSKEMYEHK